MDRNIFGKTLNVIAAGQFPNDRPDAARVLFFAIKRKNSQDCLVK